MSPVEIQAIPFWKIRQQQRETAERLQKKLERDTGFRKRVDIPLGEYIDRSPADSDHPPRTSPGDQAILTRLIEEIHGDDI